MHPCPDFPLDLARLSGQAGRDVSHLSREVLLDGHALLNLDAGMQHGGMGADKLGSDAG